MSSNFKFIIDENISPEIATLFKQAGLEAYHVNELKGHQKQRITDDQLRRLTLQKGYIIVTKDDDFVKSYVSREVPEKLIFLHGLDNKESLIKRMATVIPKIIQLIEEHNFIEINENEIRFPFSGD